MISVIDYGAGNVGSVVNMLRRIGQPVSRARTPEEINSSSKLILPGVGAFDNVMGALQASGLRPALEEAVHGRRIPLLGICVGMQILASGSEEGSATGLNWFSGRVVKIQLKDESDLKLPHMGWAAPSLHRQHPLFQGLETDARFYFVHSYHYLGDRPEDVLATVEYSRPFCCAIGKDNIVGVQFHPEKSHRFGMTLLNNFARWTV